MGDYIADLIVDEKVIVELKSVKELHPAHARPVQFTSVTA